MAVGPILKKVAVAALVWIASHPGEIKKVFEEAIATVGSMPNLPVKTLGGKYLWATVAEHDGWRLQKNKLLDYCRILDPRNIRRAWGSERSMTEILEELVKRSNQ